MCRLCFKNNIEKNPGSIIIPAKKIYTVIKYVRKKIAGSIIGPAMVGPTGPFATALHWELRIEWQQGMYVRNKQWLHATVTSPAII